MTAAERIRRLELALAESTYLIHGPRCLPMLTAQAPRLAQLFDEYMRRTNPANETFAGRQENTDQPNDREGL